MKKFFISLLLAISLMMPHQIVYGAIQTSQNETESETPDELKQLYAQSAVLLDADSGRILYSKKGESQMPMASTTKIMTCILALEYGNLEDLVTVSSNAAKQPKVHLGMQQDQQFRLKDLLYSLMLESHNDSAVAIAEHLGGSVEGFARMMNQKAKTLGAINTNFVTPNGLDATGHYTTAGDLARIMMYCIKESPKTDAFLEITRTSSYSFSDANGNGSYSCTNHNAFLSMMEGALSGKTGFTGNAGYCYVGALKQGEKTFVVALLACGWPNNKTYKWSDTKKLMNYGLEHYEYQEIGESHIEFESVPVVEGQENTVGLYCKAEPLQMLLREDETSEVKIDVPKILDAPIEADTKVGSVKYFLNGKEIRNYPIYTVNEVLKIDYIWCFKNVLKLFLL